MHLLEHPCPIQNYNGNRWFFKQLSAIDKLKYKINRENETCHIPNSFQTQEKNRKERERERERKKDQFFYNFNSTFLCY